MENCVHHHNCIEELREDHNKILQSLDNLENVIKEQIINQEQIREFLEFTANFAEPHHHKEENVLFPKLEEKGIPNEGGPIGMMLFEHTMKRNYIKELKQAVQNNNDAGIIENSRAVISLMRDHIWKENNILYPCAEDVLNEEDLKNLGEQCS